MERTGHRRDECVDQQIRGRDCRRGGGGRSGRASSGRRTGIVGVELADRSPATFPLPSCRNHSLPAVGPCQRPIRSANTPISAVRPRVRSLSSASRPRPPFKSPRSSQEGVSHSPHLLHSPSPVKINTPAHPQVLPLHPASALAASQTESRQNPVFPLNSSSNSQGRQRLPLAHPPNLPFYPIDHSPHKPTLQPLLLGNLPQLHSRLYLMTSISHLFTAQKRFRSSFLPHPPPSCSLS